jgi:hypothetical protein
LQRLDRRELQCRIALLLRDTSSLEVLEDDVDHDERGIQLAWDSVSDLVAIAFEKWNGSSGEWVFWTADAESLIALSGPHRIESATGRVRIAAAGERAFGVLAPIPPPTLSRFRSSNGAEVPVAVSLSAGNDEYLIGVPDGDERYATLYFAGGSLYIRQIRCR